MEIENNNYNWPSKSPFSPYAPYAPIPPAKPKKPLFQFTKGDIVFIILGIIGCLFTSLFGLFSGFALGYSISSVFLTSLFIFYFAKKGHRRIFPIVCALFALANSAIFVCTSNASVRFFGVIASFLLALVSFDGLVSDSQKGTLNTVGVFYSAASSLGNIGITLKSIFSFKNGTKKTVGKALLGMVCAIPVLVVVIPLLITSDDAFRGMMTSIFENSYTTIAKIMFGLGIALLVIPYGVSIKYGRVAKIKKSGFSGIENVYIIAFLSSIVICYLLYLFSQLAYFFSAFKGFLPDGNITYAQYARKGFFEICIIAVINLMITFTTWALAKKKNGKMSNCIKILATFISIFTLVIIGTAISKMVLYINAYGMTVLRLTTSAFMVFLSIVFISIIFKIFIPKTNFIKTAFLSAGIITLILGTVNVNAVCAKYNYESYVSGTLETIDVEALYDLGDEGIPYLVKLAQSEDTEVNGEAKKYLKKAYMYDYFEGLHRLSPFTVEDLKQHRKVVSLDGFSIPKATAYEALYEYLEKNPQFWSSCQSY